MMKNPRVAAENLLIAGHPRELTRVLGASGERLHSELEHHVSWEKSQTMGKILGNVDHAMAYP